MPILPFDPGTLVAASFRGVRFYVESVSGTAGRRVELHEYPNRDTPFAEDLGRAAREYSFKAYVVGPLFALERDLLLDALERHGPGLLDHPAYGQIEVAARPCAWDQAKDEGGWCRFSLSFVEAGENAYPDDSDDTAAAVETDAGASRTAFAADTDGLLAGSAVSQDAALASLAAVGALAQAVNEAFAAGIGLSGGSGGALIEARTAEMREGAADALEAGALGATIAAALRDVADFAAGLATEADLVGGILVRRSGAPTSVRRQAALDGLFTLVEAARDDGAALPVGADATPTRLRLAADRARVAALARRVALIEAARLAARLDFESADDAAALRQRFMDALDREADQASDSAGPAGPDDSGVRRLLALRAGVSRDLTARAADRSPLVAYASAFPRPALVQAWRLYPGDGDIVAHAAQLAARNRAIHPAFLPQAGQAVAA